ncbi:LexA family transcriptional regulator [Lampropedia cohaerens]|uniref:LexA repressor n=1 Tax=Lampropedia cohaerens TaxID=1610491 RepID=A0A0U1Q2S0_9BURK|nr:transcriptional repressor LexA [Lampropedia cohaerens]KKW69063.1 LexA family transcriptional regulator [Lampropedia cohaerens]
MSSLTSRQQQVLDYLRTHIERHGVPPSTHELMAAFGWRSPNAVTKHLQALTDKGLISARAHKARSLRVLPSGGGEATAPRLQVAATNDDAVWLPLVGRVAAGEPILADARIERQIAVDRWLFRPQPDFLLRVQGDSMIDDGILDGDLIAGKTTPEAEHGQTVIARVGEGITIKRLYHRGQTVRLLPRNPAYATIAPDPHEDFAIEGVYCGLLRPGDGH